MLHNAGGSLKSGAKKDSLNEYELSEITSKFEISFNRCKSGK
jgi:hypothetical protein